MIEMLGVIFGAAREISRRWDEGPARHGIDRDASVRGAFVSMQFLAMQHGPERCWPEPVYQGARAALILEGKSLTPARWNTPGAIHVDAGAERWALHHCDNRGCCNPAHLYVGNAEDNARDMAIRGRLRGRRRTLRETADDLFWIEESERAEHDVERGAGDALVRVGVQRGAGSGWHPTDGAWCAMQPRRPTIAERITAALADGPLRQSEIARALAIPPGSLCGALAKLTAAGVVCREDGGAYAPYALARPPARATQRRSA